MAESPLAEHSKPLFTLFLFFASTVALLIGIPSLQFYLNPFSLSFPQWLLAFVTKTGLLCLLDFLIHAVLRVINPPKMLFRIENPNVKGLAILEWIDLSFLAMNSVIEFTYLSNLAYFAMNSSLVDMTWRSLSILNTVCAFFLLFVVSDFFYALAHRWMHWTPVYPFIHKHHHRQILPRRGYADAGNEHPIEQVLGLATNWIGVNLVVRMTGAHAATIVAYMAVYGVLALLNHTEFELSFNILGMPGFRYSVGAHEMHHRHPKCNMAQSFMWWDKLMGTYREYIPQPKHA